MYGGRNVSQEATPAEAPAPAPDSELGAEQLEFQSFGFTDESLAYLRELPRRTADPDWHERNRQVYQDRLHRPLARLLGEVRRRHVQVLSPEVAGSKRQLLSLRKNGYGRGGYHDACGFAFYDPAVPAKSRSPQLQFRLDGATGRFEYGFTVDGQCEDYLQRLRKAVRDAPDAVCDYLRTAPSGTVVTRQSKDHCRRWTAAEWAGLLRCDASMALGSGLQLTHLCVHKSQPLTDLAAADRAGSLADEVGGLLAWAWPFFEASRTGQWPAGVQDGAGEAARQRVEGGADVDELAPRTLDELAERTALPLTLLRDMEDALLSQHQIVLTGPPGTSKTFVARQFARYFARQTPAARELPDQTFRPQGLTHTVFMHASWSYEDFFEGLRPVENGAGRLVFENRPGVFLRWVTESLRFQHPKARHVLVLDELNRCDTAAVLGELLQLLEYRGVTVPLLSGRPFVFPANLYLIGTMNSADRSVGRIDLALRRRFFWINLHPQPEVLARWLARPGNNPAGFDAGALRAVNDLLAERGVPPEQQVGHALFMGGGPAGAEDEGATGDAQPADCALTERRLRQVVQFSVLPYVRELMRELLLGAPGAHATDDVLPMVEAILLDCLTRRKSA